MAEVIKKFDGSSECPHCHKTIGFDLGEISFWKEIYNVPDNFGKRTFEGDLKCPNCGKEFAVRHSGFD